MKTTDSLRKLLVPVFQRVPGNRLLWPAVFLTGVIFSPLSAKGATKTFNGGQITIPDNAAATPSTVSVNGVSGPVTAVRLKLNNFQHTYPADVDAFLVSPVGKVLPVMSDAGGESGSAIDVNLVFDDHTGFPLINQTTAPASGTYRPSDYTAGTADTPPAGSAVATLLALAAAPANGNWTVHTFDDFAGDPGGSIASWSLEIDFDPVVTTNVDNVSGSLRQAITDAASGDTITFAPSLSGQPITLSGGTRLDITKDLTIDASALPDGITIDGNGTASQDSVIVINTAEVTIDSLTITGGNAVSNLSQGGGILVFGGRPVTIRNSTFDGNTADVGGPYSATTTPPQPLSITVRLPATPRTKREGLSAPAAEKQSLTTALFPAIQHLRIPAEVSRVLLVQVRKPKCKTPSSPEISEAMWKRRAATKRRIPLPAWATI